MAIGQGKCWQFSASSAPLRCREILAACACVLALCGISRAELQPSQVFIVYNRNLPVSREIAEYYMKRRGVPATQSIGLALPLPDGGDNISRADYLAKVRVPLRGWLRHEKLQDKIKCIVTVYGVPLRIGGTGVMSEDKPLLRETNAELDSATAEMEGLIAALEKFTSQPQPTSVPVAGKSDPSKQLARYEELRQKAIERGRTAANPAEAAGLTRELGGLLQRGEGLEMIASHLQSTEASGRQAIEAMRAEVVRQRDQIKPLLAECPRGQKRREVHKKIGELFGLRGLIGHLQDDQARLEGRETQAALGQRAVAAVVGGLPAVSLGAQPDVLARVA